MAKILIIEDDEVFGELLFMHLENQGHEPHIARTLEQGTRWLIGDAPDAILLDHQLPDGFGLDLLAIPVDTKDTASSTAYGGRGSGAATA